MIHAPLDVLKAFPVRKTGKQKQAFRDAVQSYVSGLGYEIRVEKGSLGSRNLVIGDADKAKYLVTAHYDTPAGMLIPNLITPCNPLTFILYQLFVVALFFLAAFVVALVVMLLTNDELLTFWAAYIAYFGMLFLMMMGPANRNNANDNTSGVAAVLETARSLPEEMRGDVCFVLFDLEEAGLVGSSSYRKIHKKATEKQIVLNMDCVGDGDEIVFFPTGKMKKDPVRRQWLRRVCAQLDSKRIWVRERGFSYYPSDQKNFPLGVGIAALHRSKWAGLYLARIHTKHDTVLEEENLNILRDCLIKLMAETAAE